MNSTQRYIHNAEFAVHLGLYAAGPVWTHAFGKTVASDGVEDMRNRLMRGSGPLPPEDIEVFAASHLGPAAVIWLREDFISTGRPRADQQAEIFVGAIRPTVAPEGTTAAALGQVITDDVRLSLQSLEQLMMELMVQEDDPRDAAFVAEAHRAHQSSQSHTKVD